MSNYKNYGCCTVIAMLLLLHGYSQVIPKTGAVDLNKYNRNLLISYEIMLSTATNNGVAETYNGGIKTVFIKDNLARVRLVSLMRTQSIFFNNQIGVTKQVAAILKESGKVKTKMLLSAKKWKTYQQKNTKNSTKIYAEDTLTLLNFVCKKAIVTNADSTTLQVYYYPTKVNKTWVAAEPLFKDIPGIVLKYSYTKNDKTIHYTATKLESRNIATSVFLIPTKGYKNITLKPTTGSIILDMGEEEEENTEEDENEMDETLETKTILPPPVL